MYKIYTWNIFTEYPNDFWQKSNNLDPCNVLMTIATNIPVLHSTCFQSVLSLIKMVSRIYFILENPLILPVCSFDLTNKNLLN